jgi:hypothetical protein
MYPYLDPNVNDDLRAAPVGERQVIGSGARCGGRWRTKAVNELVIWAVITLKR